MNIVIDKRNTDIIYVDKANSHVANNNEVLKLINNDNESNINIYIKLIAGANSLNDTEIAILKYIITHNNNALVPHVCTDVAEIINKSSTTVSRAIGSLRTKRLIYINALNYVAVYNAIAVNKSTISNAKFIVIELHPEITSKGITI